MSRRRISLILSFFVLFLPFVAFANDTDIFISEVQIAGNTVEDEFIEIYNPKEIPFSLDGLKICRKTSTGSFSQVKSFSAKDIIPEKSYFLFAHSNGVFVSIPSDANTKSSSLSSDNSIAIVDSCDTKNPPHRIFDSVAWGSGKPFDEKTFLETKNIQPSKSLVRNRITLDWSLSDTPTPTNSHGQTLVAPPKPDPDPVSLPSTPTIHDIRINEIFPNPAGSDRAKEWVELFNFGTAFIDLKGWNLITLSGSSVNLKETSSGNDFLVVPLSLRNTNDTVSLLDPSGTIINAVSYEDAPSGNSLNFFKQGVYRWSKTPTPGAENILGNAPETKEKDIPETASLGVLTTFSASGKDTDGDNIKYTWDFGDGHKSYKKETTHRYEEEGKYEGTLTVSDGTESVVTTFTITVEKYDAPKVRMTTLIPNPTGRDTDAEYITLENRSRKSVNLLGWSIATGWKKLANHPIRESFIIPKKSERNLTHDFSAFTLPNEKGRIELRSPDGETVQKLKYNLKGKSAEEGSLLVKEKRSGWKWILPQLTENSKQTTTQTTDAPPKGGTTAVVDREEEQLKRDTEIIDLKKRRGEELFSTEQNPTEEMRRLISYGTNIETPIAVLATAPRVAGTSDETTSPEKDNTPTDININALINHWLERE